MYRPKITRINKNRYDIAVIGNRDPRGYDNNIIVEVNEQDELIITVPKAYRCYRFNRVEEDGGYVKVIAN